MSSFSVIEDILSSRKKIKEHLKYFTMKRKEDGFILLLWNLRNAHNSK